jgi:hypothetical protein
MSLTLTAIDTQVGGSQVSVWVAVTPSGTYTTGGDTLDFTKILNPNFLAKPFPSRIFIVPPGVYLEEMGGPYTGILDGTSLSNYKMKFYTGGGAEFGNGSNYSTNLNLTNFNVAGTTGSKLIIQLVWKTGT